MARMMEMKGRVVGLEYIPALVQTSKQNIENDDGELLRVIELKHGNGWDGYDEFQPYDAIHVGAAAATMPMALVRQLKPNGIMVIPVGGDSQYFYRITKRSDGTIDQHRMMGVRYVPLVQ
jgi:protein-L-isoaspartate(D-aspartate) O-methyltransferase